MSAIQYEIPRSWVLYDFARIQRELVEAKSVVLALREFPYQRTLADRMQQLELKREVAGTSRIEGADFTDRELDEALRESPEQLLTRSQRQAHAAVQTYRWIATVPNDRPVTDDLILEIHRRIVTGADDDHCEPGALRRPDQNVTFGLPRHRGASGGDECKAALEQFARALQKEYREHDPIIQSLAAHYHLAAMHPFLDGNGRTARALEALLLQRAGLRDTCFIAMSNYYYDEKPGYLAALAESRTRQHDLTPFLAFALRGIVIQGKRLLDEIRLQVQKALFRNVMFDLFNRLQTPRQRVIAKRQLEILKVLLSADEMPLFDVFDRLKSEYQGLRNGVRAYVRDVMRLGELHAIQVDEEKGTLRLRSEWATEITESDFLQRMKSPPKGKTYRFLH